MDYRIERLVKRLKYEKIVVYGTGINAKRVVDALSDRDIIGILDRDTNSGYFEGIKILTIDEMLLKHPKISISSLINISFAFLSNLPLASNLRQVKTLRLFLIDSAFSNIFCYSKTHCTF